MLITERTRLTSKVIRASNLLNFYGRLLGRNADRALTRLIVEGNAARGIVFGDQDCLSAELFLEDYRRVRNSVLKWLIAAVFYIIITASVMFLIFGVFAWVAGSLLS